MTVDWADPALADSWDKSGPRLPTRAEQLDIAIAELESAREGWILDLGAGSGLVAEQLLERLPGSRVLCVDLSERMLELARRRLERFGDRFELAHVDLEAEEAELLERDYAAAIAVQAFHNLSHLRQVVTIRLLSETLPAGALFVLVDKVAVPEAAYELFLPVWRRLERMSGFSPEPPSYAEHVVSLEEEGDRPVPLERQLEWLRQANFEPAVLHVHGNRAVVGARRLGR